MLDTILLAIRKKLARWQGKSYVRTGKCNQCGFCCTMVTLFMDDHPVLTEEEFNYLLEIFPEYRRFNIRGRDADSHLLFTCKYLSDDFKCTDYKNRPSICRDYPNDLIMTKGGKLVSKCGYTLIPVEDFQALLDRIMDSSEAGETETGDDEAGTEENREFSTAGKAQDEGIIQEDAEQESGISRETKVNSEEER